VCDQYGGARLASARLAVRSRKYVIRVGHDWPTVSRAARRAARPCSGAVTPLAPSVSTAELLREATDLAGDLADVSGEHPPDLARGALWQGSGHG
jgi:hypothetical protein